MKDIYVVYWSSTGNTQAMADLVAEGITEAGANAKVVEVSAMDAALLKDADCFALGASAMGAEVLDDEMDSFVTEVEAFAGGKTIGLFGSYDWGDGEWMRDWVSRMEGAGAKVAGGEAAIVNMAPDDDEKINACKALGKELAK